MGSYSSNSPLSANDVSSLPVCEEDGTGYYVGVGCSVEGTFTLDRFTDQYCLEYNDTYGTLNNFNTAMNDNNLSECYTAYSSETDLSIYSSLSAYLIPESRCTTSAFIENQRSSGYLVLTNKLKFGLGGSMMLGSVIMVCEILLLRRRERTALLHRKYSKRRSRSKRKRRKKKKDGSHMKGNSVLA